MKNLRLVVPSLALAALTGTGCWITSAQIFAHFALTNPFTIDNAAAVPFEREYVDLSVESQDYKDNKDKLKTLSDLAVVGTFTNNVPSPAGGVEFYITPGNTNLGSVPAITSGATKLWGPGTIGAAPATRTIGWDDSAALFTAAGKQILIDAATHDGTFTIYAIGTAGTYNITVTDGFLILVLDAAI